MAQSLYRTYRPQVFEDLVGQEHISKTLQNALTEGSVAHAYLFTGPRGTGKTTSARILAKALLCGSGPTATPGGTCAECTAIAEGTHPDVYELDAASRTGVDAVREEIIGRVQYAPTRGGYKVYIIDEVHMLSTAAFNALLKTLEEPPPHVVFVLCTTHPHKVPETIHSRCQRFDFRRISTEDIVSRLRHISDSEGFSVDDHALQLIARHAVGGMRDAITTLEQVAAFTGGSIGLEDIEGLIGEVDSAELFEIAGLIAQRDIPACFRWAADFAERGTDIAQFTKDLTAHIRDLYLVTLTGGEWTRDTTDAAESARVRTQAAEFGGPQRLARALEILGDLSMELREATDQRLRLEIAFTRLCRPEGDEGIAALYERVEALERSQRFGTTPQPVHGTEVAPPERPIEVSDGGGAASPRVVAAVTDAPEASVPKRVAPTSASGALDISGARRAWPAIVAEMKKLKPSRGAMFINASVDLDSDGTLLIVFPKGNEFAVAQTSDAAVRSLIGTAIESVLGVRHTFRVTTGSVSTGACPLPVDRPNVAEPDPVREPDSEKDAFAEAPPSEPRDEPAVEPASSSASEDPLLAMLESTFGQGLVVEELELAGDDAGDDMVGEDS